MRRVSILLLVGAASLADLSSGFSQTQLDQACTVSALNRSTQVQPDGSWVLPNVPANVGQVRVRATCVVNGVTRSGQSEFVLVPADGVIRVPEIDFDVPTPVPASLSLGTGTINLTFADETVQLSATATLPSGSAADLTSSAAGTNYRSSNPAIATVGVDGLVTAVASGTVLVSALNEGALAVRTIRVTLSGDSDGDGLPDDYEVAHGLDPNNPADAVADPDADGLTTLAEFQLGTDPLDADSDVDGLLDGQEVNSVGTDPLLFDTDGDGLGDGLEVSTGSDPLDRQSFNLAAALASLDVSPPVAHLLLNEVLGEASRQLRVTGTLIDGRPIDLTARSYGTNFSSSDLAVANFGADDGRVYAGQDGPATITVDNSGHVATADVTVETFAPRALSFLRIPGYPNAVAIEGDYAFVAAGGTGLQVVDVSNLEAPRLVGALDTRGNANDVRVRNGVAYVADGWEGLAVIDVSDPQAPSLLGETYVNGTATDLTLVGDLVYVADEVGLSIVDVSDPSQPLLLGWTETTGRARGVEVEGSLALVTDSRSGVHVVDVSDPAAPAVLASTSTRANGTSSAADVTLWGGRAWVADGADNTQGGLAAISFDSADNPVLTATSTGAFGLTSIAAERGFVLASDYLFTNAVPIFDVRSGSPLFRAVLDFSGAPSFRQDYGNSLAVRDGVVFLAASCCGFRDNGVTDNGGLHIGRYALFDEEGGDPPTVELTEPQQGATAEERRSLVLRAEAEDDVRVESVRFVVNGDIAAVDYAAPYEATISVPGGAPQLTIQAVATDSAGNESSSDTVAVAVQANARPEVTLLTPQPGQSAVEGTPLTLAATASDDQAVTRVEFSVNGQLRNTDTEAPYRFVYTLGLGVTEVAISAVAYDDIGPSEVAGPATVPVQADQPPSVVLLSPTDGDEVVEYSPIRIIAGAGDDVGVSFVRFLVGGSLLVNVGSPPYEWSVTAPAAGSTMTIQVVARDGRLHETSSSVITVHGVPDPLASLQGRTVDETGAPIAGAQVEVYPADGFVLSAADGSFLVEGLPTNAGDLYVSASAFVGAASFSGQLDDGIPPLAGETLDVGDVVLVADYPPTTVVGTVVDELGAPVGGATVKVYDDITVLSTVSSADGRFTIVNAPSDHGLSISAVVETSGVRLRGTSSVSPVAGEVSDAGDVVVYPTEILPDPLTTVVGQVLDLDGQPLADAAVNVFTNFDAFSTTAAADGSFVVTGVPTLDGDLYATAWAVIAGQIETGQSDYIAPEPGGTTDLGEIELGGGGGGPVSLLWPEPPIPLVLALNSSSTSCVDTRSGASRPATSRAVFETRGPAGRDGAAVSERGSSR
jgi:hypothetical protein